MAQHSKILYIDLPFSDARANIKGKADILLRISCQVVNAVRGQGGLEDDLAEWGVGQKRNNGHQKPRLPLQLIQRVEDEAGSERDEDDDGDDMQDNTSAAARPIFPEFSKVPTCMTPMSDLESAAAAVSSSAGRPMWSIQVCEEAAAQAAQVERSFAPPPPPASPAKKLRRECRAEMCT